MTAKNSGPADQNSLTRRSQKNSASAGAAAPLEIKTHWQTVSRGTNDDEYQIYVQAAESLGWSVKTYDEWLNS